MYAYQALPAYLGGKRRLCPLLFALINDIVPRTSWRDQTFLDPFSGGGSVALTAKAQGFRVVASDLSERATVVGRALIANSTAKLQPHDIAELSRPELSLLSAAAPDGHSSALTSEQTAWLELAVANAHLRPEPVRSLLLLLVIKTVLRLFPMSLPSASDAPAAVAGDWDRVSSRRIGHYLKARAFCSPEHLRKVAKEINAGVFGGNGEARQADALSAIRETGADLLYLDPPYADTTGYADSYDLVDRLLGQPPITTPAPTLPELLEASHHIPLVVLSYGGPTVTLEELAALVGQSREVVKAIAVPYAHLASVAKEESRDRNREFIIIAR